MYCTMWRTKNKYGSVIFFFTCRSRGKLGCVRQEEGGGGGGGRIGNQSFLWIVKVLLPCGEEKEGAEEMKWPLQ